MKTYDGFPYTEMAGYEQQLYILPRNGPQRKPWNIGCSIRSERIHDILEEAEGLRDRIINDLEELQDICKALKRGIKAENLSTEEKGRWVAAINKY